jgi:hypothetical protein
MKPDPANLLGIAGIKTPLVGFYDVPNPEPFEPYCTPKRCIFACYENWVVSLWSVVAVSTKARG